MNADKVLEKYKVDASLSKIRALNELSDMIASRTDQFDFANRIVKDFGVEPLTNFTDAKIMALTLVEQAIEQGSDFDIQKAGEAGKMKIEKISTTMPYLYYVKGNVVMEGTNLVGGSLAKVIKASFKGKSSSKSSDKKEKARAIFDANKDKKPSDIAKLIQVELGITFANAYYYVSRVFK